MNALPADNSSTQEPTTGTTTSTDTASSISASMEDHLLSSNSNSGLVEVSNADATSTTMSDSVATKNNENLDSSNIPSSLLSSSSSSSNKNNSSVWLSSVPTNQTPQSEDLNMLRRSSDYVKPVPMIDEGKDENGNDTDADGIFDQHNHNDSMDGKPISSTKLPTEISTAPKCIAPPYMDPLSSDPDMKSNSDGNHDGSHSPSSSSLKNNNTTKSISSATAKPYRDQVGPQGKSTLTSKIYEKTPKDNDYKKDMARNDSTESTTATGNKEHNHGNNNPNAENPADTEKERKKRLNQKKKILDTLAVIFPIIYKLCGSLVELTQLDEGGFLNDREKEAVKALGGAIITSDRKWKWTGRKIKKRKEKAEDRSDKFLKFIGNKNEIRHIVKTIINLLRTTTYGKEQKEVLSVKLKLKLGDQIIDKITDAATQSLTASLPSSDPPTTDRDGESLTPSTTSSPYTSVPSTDRSMSLRSAESSIPCDDQRILTEASFSSSDPLANAFEFDNIDDDNDDDVDADDARNSTNNGIDDNTNANVLFASNNVVERRNPGSNGNLKEGGCDDDSHECEEISLQLDKASDSQLEKITADLVERAKTAEQKAIEVAKLSKSKANDKAERVKIAGNHGSYTGDFDDHKSGHGVYCEDNPRDGNPGCFESTGMYKNGRETGPCEVDYKDDYGTTFRGEMDGGDRHGYGVLIWKENNKECRYEGRWINNCRHGIGLCIDGSSLSFGPYESNEAVGTHVTWDSNSEHCCGDNDDDNNTDKSDGGIDAMLNSTITNDSNNQNKVPTSSTNVTSGTSRSRGRRGGYKRLRGAALRAHHERQNKKGIGAKNTTDKSGKCVDRVLKQVIGYLMDKDDTYVFAFKSNNKDGPQTRSKGSDIVEYCDLDDKLAEVLDRGRTVDGWTEQEYLINHIKQWGLEAKHISRWRFGQSSVKTLSRREPIFIVVELALNPEYGGPKVENKDIGPIYNMTHAMCLLHGKLIDPDGKEYTLSREEVQFFTNSNHTYESVKEEAKKVFTHCLGIEFSYRIADSFLINDTRTK